MSSYGSRMGKPKSKYRLVVFYLDLRIMTGDSIQLTYLLNHSKQFTLSLLPPELPSPTVMII